MKNYLIFRTALIVIVVSLFTIFSCSKQKSHTITLTNPSDLELTNKAIAIDKAKLLDVPSENQYPIITTEKGDTISSQLDDLNGDGLWDQVFFVANIPAKGSSALSITWSEKEPVYVMQTSIRFGKRDSKEEQVHPKTSDTLYADKIHGRLGYQPYQTDGPSWENNKVGFRHYFDGRNSKDLFGKKAAYMSPDSVGINAAGAVEDNYHVMADWGRDVLAVGNSTGIGGVNLMIGDSISRIGCVAGDTVTNVESSVFNIVKEGPVHSVFTIQHNNWKPFDRTYQVEEKVSIWPGMYAYQDEVSFSGLKGDETMLVGLVNSNTPNPLKELLVDDKYIVLFTHDQQTYDRVWWLGLGLILPKDAYLGYGEAPKTGKFSNTFYGKLKVENNKPLTYYAVACWELSDERFKEAAYFEKYIGDLAAQLAVEVGVDVK